MFYLKMKFMQSNRHTNRVVPDDAKKKPEVVSVYNSGMNDQYWSYYTPGTTSKKW